MSSLAVAQPAWATVNCKAILNSAESEFLTLKSQAKVCGEMAARDEAARQSVNAQTDAAGANSNVAGAQKVQATNSARAGGVAAERTAGIVGVGASMNAGIRGISAATLKQCQQAESMINAWNGKYASGAAAACPGVSAIATKVNALQSTVASAMSLSNKTLVMAGLGVAALAAISKSQKSGGRAIQAATRDNGDGTGEGGGDTAGPDGNNGENGGGAGDGNGAGTDGNGSGNGGVNAGNDGLCGGSEAYSDAECVEHFTSRCEGYLMSLDCRDFSSHYCERPSGVSTEYCENYAVARRCAVEANKPDADCALYYQNANIDPNSICDPQYTASACMEVFDAASNPEAFNDMLNDCGTYDAPRGNSNRCQLFIARYPYGEPRQRNIAVDNGTDGTVVVTNQGCTSAYGCNGNAGTMAVGGGGNNGAYTGSAVIGGGAVTMAYSVPSDINSPTSNNSNIVSNGVNYECNINNYCY